MSDSGLYIALTGLFAQKKCIDVTAHNIANASTPGYSRQRAELVTNEPRPVPSIHMAAGPGQMGTGVDVKTISRIRDLFLDMQIRQQNNLNGEWQQRSDALNQVEATFMEPSDNGLNSALDKFWDAWNQLSKFSDSSPVRTTVAETSATLADNLRNTYNQLQTQQKNLNDKIGIKVDHVNDLLTQIANLNNQIHAASAADLSPNDLMDRRDALLKELSSTVSFQATMQQDNTVSIAVGNAAVVNGPKAIMLERFDSKGNYQVGITLGTNTLILQWPELGGELKGLAQARDNDIKGYLDGLDQLATTLSKMVNSQHMQGYGLGGETGIPFFVGSNNPVTPPPPVGSHQVASAGAIFVNPYIIANPSRIAAATGVTLSPGDNGNALAITRLKDQALPFVNASGALVGADTVNNFYRSLISALGVDSSQAQNMVKNQEALLGQLHNRSEGISGISLDEEMANMIQYQNAYQAAARLIGVISEMMDTLINLGRR